MMEGAVKIEGGFAEVGAGSWLMGHGQPAAYFGTAVRRHRKGFFLRDRASIDLVETSSTAKCADAGRPFLTHIPCAAPIFAVSSKVLVAPAAARTGAQSLKVIPMSMKGVLCVTDFGGEWVLMATASRTARLQVEDGDTLSVRPESVVAWTGNRPTGFCPKLGILDILLPRQPRNLVLHFHGPTVVWVEGAKDESRRLNVGRRCYGA
jgi:hypothetical protein